MDIISEVVEGNEDVIINSFISNNEHEILKLDRISFMLFLTLSGALIIGLKLFWAGSATPLRIIASLAFSALIILLGTTSIEMLNWASEHKQLAGLLTFCLLLMLLIIL
ncbi:MAG: hypothetical protein QXW00_02150 [Candidatus Woesearchaeota archaeon]